MPLIFAARCGGRSSSHRACTSAAVTESWPQPAHSVDIAPSYSRLVSPSEFLGRDGWRTGGLVIEVIGLPAAGCWLLALVSNTAARRSRPCRGLHEQLGRRSTASHHSRAPTTSDRERCLSRSPGA